MESQPYPGMLVNADQVDSFPTGRWAAQRAAKADGGPDGADVRAGVGSGSLGPSVSEPKKKAK